MDTTLPTIKELKALADACRKAGIKSFKGMGMEFTLADEAPEPRRRSKRPQAEFEAQSEAFVSEMPSDEALLFWSAPDLADEEAAS
jgi:hypothetical protein